MTNKSRWRECLDRCEKATSGPWSYRHPGEYLTLCGKPHWSENQNWAKLEGPDIYNDFPDYWWSTLASGDIYREDAEFIAHARTDLPDAARIALAAEAWRAYIHDASPDDDPGSLDAIDAILEGRGPNE